MFRLAYKTAVTSLTLLICGALSGNVHASTWLIQPDGGGDAPTIQAGVDSAATGDTLLLASGTYMGVGNRGVSFNGKALVLCTQGGPDVTIMDCERQDRGFRFESGETSTSVVSGLTITNGDPGKSAGGIFCTGASPTIDNCVLLNNAADEGNAGGGGLFCIDFASPTVTNTRFIGNNASSGGAVWCGNAAQPTFTNCIFAGNNALSYGGAIACFAFGRPTLTSCTIADNTAGNQGSALYLRDAGPYFFHTIVTSSTAGSVVFCDTGAAPSFNCCDIFGAIVGGYTPDLNGGDNVFADPLFCGVDGSGNFFLQSDSPCTPDNSPCGILIGAFPIDCGTTPNESPTWGNLKSIYR